MSLGPNALSEKLAEAFRRCCAAAFAAFFSCAAWWSLRIVHAEYLADDISVSSTRAALRLTPDNPDLYFQLASSLLPSDPGTAAMPSSNAPEIAATMATAISLNRDSSTLWLEAADFAEKEHDFPAAEAHLLHAVWIDRTFAPRGMLAEYYARRRDALHFWPAVRTAIAASYADITPLLQICWDFTPTPAEILPLALRASDIPIRTASGNPARVQYLDFFLSKHRLDLADSVATSLLPTVAANPDSTPSLLTYSDRLLWHNRPARALEIWNALSAARRIPYSVLNPASESAPHLINGSFETPFLYQGFDWRLSSAPGVSVTQSPREIQSDLSGKSTAALRFAFSGKQTEHAELASQFVLLAPGELYRFTVAYRVESNSAVLAPGSSPGPDTGFHLRLNDMSTPAQDLLAGAAPLRNLPGPQSEVYRFRTPPSPVPTPNSFALYRLVLTYDRSLGTTRFEGDVVLHRIQLGFAS